jgi:hypothetical protein
VDSAWWLRVEAETEFCELEDSMLPMENTYTYTARSANDPQKVVTFTLFNDRIAIDVAALMEQVERVVASRGEGSKAAGEADGAEKAGGAQPAPLERPWLAPGAASLLERATEAIRLTDVEAESPDGGLRLTAWVRANNLRLAPILFRMKKVDNPRAAEDFVNEIQRRKEEAPASRRLPGPFDYWAGWALGGAMAVGALAAWLWPRRARDAEAQEDEIRVESE